MRDQIVAGNWKMNNNQSETEFFLNAITKQTKPTDVRVMLAPSFTQLSQAVIFLKNDTTTVVAQNMNAEAFGAYTGEISADMLKGIGVMTVVLGHSERRAMNHETDEVLAKKVETALASEMEIIFCFGEELEDRKSGNYFDIVEKQITKALFDLSEGAWSSVILAYEPVWAIGTGETASPEQAQEMHAFIRDLIGQKYNTALADKVSILYGGSVKPKNAKDIFSNKDVDGGLIGGASLNIDDFMAIVNSF
jgi:triosephosphate isomerase